MSKVNVKALTLTNSWLSIKSNNKKGSEDYKNYIFRIYRENGNYWYKIRDFFIIIGFTINYWKSNIRKILKWTLWCNSSNWLSKWYPNLEIDISIEIDISTRGFQRDQNCQIPICISEVIDRASQHPNSDWKWTMVGQALNWGANDHRILQIFYPRKADKTRNPMKPESCDSELRSERYPYFKISENSDTIWAKMKNKMTFKAKLTS